MKRAPTAKTLCALAIACSTSFALAHSGATGIVKMRMDMMSDISNQMKTIGTMFKGAAPFNAKSVSTAAAKISTHSNGLKKAFPEGSIKGPSEALPSIWKDRVKFDALLEQMESAALELSIKAVSATGPQDIAPNFKSLGQTCSACHQSFRK